MMPTDPQVRAEAAVWLARLRSDSRRPGDEAGFQAWLAEAVEHERAFEAVTCTFDAAGAVGHEFSVSDDPPPYLLSRRRVLVGTAASALVAASSGSLLWWRSTSGVIAGEVGRPRAFVLADGSRIMLDTKSSVQVRLSGERRLIRLLAGRARFEVAKDAARPFIVDTGERQVIAIGTAITVAAEGGSMSVVLEEGRVVVRSPRAVTDVAAGTEEMNMQPGDRLVFGKDAARPVEDRPDLARIGSWQTGRLAFDDESLFSAAAELNRYNHRTIEVEDARAAGLRVSGIYRADDPEGFVRSVSLMFPLDIDENADRILIRSRNS
jgi:transmembrane sensor